MPVITDELHARRAPFRIVCLAPDGLPDAPVPNFRWFDLRFETRAEADARAEDIRQHHARAGTIVQVAVVPPYPDWWRQQ